MRRYISRVLACCCTLTIGATFFRPVTAATIYWDGPSASWNIAGSWSTASNATIPDPGAKPGAADIAIFNITTVNSATTVNLDAAQAALGLVINNTATTTINTGAGTNTLSLGASGITINPGGGNFTINTLLALTSAQSWTHNTGTTFTVNNNIANGANTLTVTGTGSGNTIINGIIGNGAGGLTKSGIGTLTMSNANTYTGGTIINGGILAVAWTGNNGASAVGGSALTINNGGTLRVDTTNALGFNGNGPVITINTGGLMTIAAGPTAHLNNVILSGGTLASPAASGQAAAFGSYNLDNNLTAGGTTATSTISSAFFAITTVGGTTFTVNPGATNGIDLDVTGVIAAPVSAGNTALIKAGNGVMRLTNTNTWTAGTTINAGTISIAANANLGGASGPLTFNGGTLQTTATFSLSSGRVITFNAGGATFNTDSGTSLSIPQLIGGVGGLTKKGSGTLNLNSSTSSAHTFAGPLNVLEGTVTLTKSISQAGGVITTTTINIGDGIGTPASAILTANDLAIVPNIPPNVSIMSDGFLSTSGQNSIASVTMNGGTIFSAANEFGNTLGFGGVTTTASSITAMITGEIATSGVYNIAQGTTPSGIDLDIPAHIYDGITPIIKTGAGTLRLSGSNDALFFSGGVKVSAGLLRIGSFNAIGLGSLLLDGGTIQSDGTFTLANTVTLTNISTVTGIFDLTFNGPSSGTGGLIKNGSHTLTFAGANSFSGPITINAGTLIMSANSSFTGNVVNHGTFVYNGGPFAGRLTNNGTFTFNANFTAGNGMENSGFITLPAGRTFTLLGAGLDNKGTFNLTGGVLVLSDTAVNFNSGNFNLSTSLALGGAQLSNTGSLALNSGVITGTATLTNQGAGVISGSGSISTPFANSGTIALTGGNLIVSQPFVNSGDIQLGSVAALLSGGAITNAATIGGFGKINSNVVNNGIIQPLNGTLVFNGTVANSAAGMFAITSGAKILMQGAGIFPTNAGLISLISGIFDNGGQTLNNTGQITGYGTINTGGLTNNGDMTLTGGTTTVHGPVTNAATKTINILYQPAIFTGSMTNNGTIKVTDTTVTFTGSYTGNAYISDPSTNIFQSHVTIISGGSMTGGIGDVFNFSGPTVTNNGTFNNGGSLISSSPTINTGTFTQSGPQAWSPSATFTNNAGTANFQSDAGSPSSSPLNIILNAGTVNFSSTQHLNSLTLNGSLATILAGTTVTKTLTIAGGANAWTAKLDLRNNSLILANNGDATIGQTVTQRTANQIKQGLNINDTLWTGNGITSSTAAADPNTTLALGIIQNNDAGVGVGDGTSNTPGSPIYTTFNGETVATNDTLVKFTYFGDADLSGIIDDTDYFLINNGFATGATGWLNGDFDYNGLIDDTDYFLINNAFALQSGPLSSPLALPIPEPATLALLACTAIPILARRRRHSFSN